MADQLLTTKHALLSGGGSLYSDMYYSSLNSTGSLCEMTFNNSQILTLPSLSFGSSVRLQVPNLDFVGNMWLHVRLPNLVQNQTVCRGWLYGLLQSVSYTLGSSSTSQITLEGDSILQVALSQITDREKRNQVLELAGEEWLEPLGDNEYLDAYALIPSPFSSFCDKLPIDSNLLSQPITIQLTFRRQDAIYGGTGARPTQFLVGEVLLRQGELTNRAMSLRNMMQSNPDLIATYPFIHHQHFETNKFVGVKESSGSMVSIDLNGFINSDIVNICFWIVKNSDKYQSNNNSPNPFYARDMSNIRLVYNGNVLYNAPAKMHKLCNLLPHQGAEGFDYSCIRPGNVSDFASDPVSCDLVHIDFSRLRSVCLPEQHMYNTMRLSNQTLKLTFNTPDTDEYTLYATYSYNSVVEIQNGITSIFMD